MIYIEKDREEPGFWSEFKKKHPDIEYKDLDKTEEGRAVRAKLRQYLIEEQGYVCGYCCRKIDQSDSMNEHIRPQAVYPNDTMDYKNLVASCVESSQTCGSRKGHEYDESRFVSPLDEDCESHFAFYPNGEIEGLTQEGQYTIELLGLDSYALQRARKATYKFCESLDDDAVKWCLKKQDGHYLPFIDVIRYFSCNNMSIRI